mmetsp:Transcript_72530/g.151451  ORF Transcript_72530/g.151451 Transcript_72530/m.151451 type:complete len:364 (+) Transcript_72530:77-1168(+)|eukprot:CAMPEP_0181326536 /NCGR_PEP_ID=MMETSP1101-20121128/21559_1 /TAXON_ID=46948 /ORGANISM="Rhodomonas abbreviata, Strain Caron Lab Isolate" /LENGTH=363 /DNA_ID=CAMNT_0023435013 /DNA_START=77 /DNA_END=1168 /DNA_ORIENTATION=-
MVPCKRLHSVNVVATIVVLCAVACSAVNAASEHKQRPHIDLRSDAAATETKSTKVCTPDMPFALSSVGMPNICLKASIPAGKECGYSLDLAVEWANSDTPIFNTPVDLMTRESCATGKNMSTSTFPAFCGENVKVCVDFHNNGNDKNRTLRIGQEFVHGCPSITISDCYISGTFVPLPPLSLPLDCFTIGEDCGVFRGCNECLQNGCGWCNAGYTEGFRCMPGTNQGPSCNGECGSGECKCDWFFDECPMNRDKIKTNHQEINRTAEAVKTEQERLEKLKEGIRGEESFPLLGRVYECLPADEVRHEHSGHTAVAVGVSFATAFVGIVAGVFLGKAGYWDIIFRRGEGGGTVDGPSLYNRHDV